MSSPSHTSEQRNAEIWSTRLQRELLALTAGGAEDTQDVVGVLPPFLTLQDHQLDIEHGIATVAFHMTVPGAPVGAAGQTETTESTTEAQTEEEQEPIVIVLDASMPHKGKHHETVDMTKVAYPFVKPKVLLKTGASRFPPHSTIQNGDPLTLDCDWTPSLHLTDAVLNVGLQIKESILQGEPYHRAVSDDPMEEVVKGARRIGTFLSKSARGWVPQAATLSSETEGASATTTTASSPKKKRTPTKKKATSSVDLAIGDEISLLEAPWVECRGVYSCKAIRRPGFVEDAMALAGQQQQQEVSQSTEEADDGPIPEDFGSYMKLHAGSIGEVAGAGFAGAGAMFRSFTKSAKSLVEESFIMITDTHIIELKSSKLNLSTGIVTFVIAIDMMAKLKFRRQESISLFFKPAPDDPLIYMCPDSADAVRQIQSVLQSHGVKGKHTNAATQRAVHEALQLVHEIQAKERALEYKPSTERVNEIMDLYRQAAERFEVAGDPRHEEVVEHMRKFLALPLVVSILDGTYVPPSEPEPAKQESTPTKIPEGEVIERTPEQLAAHDDHDGAEEPAKAKEEDKKFEENMDSILKEAKEDLENLNVDGGDDLDDLLKESDADGDAAIADLDAMLSAADKELADIMNS